MGTDATNASAPTQGSGSSSRTFIFGDPRRPRSLALACVVTLAMFPALWFGLLILWALGAPAQSDAKSLHDERVLVVIAGVVAGLGLVAAVLDWAQMRGRYSPEERTPIRSTEGAVSAVVVVAALAVAIGIGGMLWNLVP